MDDYFKGLDEAARERYLIPGINLVTNMKPYNNLTELRGGEVN